VQTFEARLEEDCGVALQDCVETVDPFEIVVSVEDVDLCQAFASRPATEPAGAAIRQSIICANTDMRLIARENHLGAFASADVSPRQSRRALLHLQAFRTRRRVFLDSRRGLTHALRLVQAAAADLGSAWALSLFLRAEREYWAKECAAGAVAQQRQRCCGIGWGNAVRAVFATSRDHLALSLEIFAALGCQPIQPLEAGCPIQLYSRAHGGALYLDVDLALGEMIQSFETSPSPLVRLGRAGRWCALFGESLLEGGLVSLTGLYHQHFFDRVAPQWGFAIAGDGAVNAGRRAISAQRIATLLAQHHLNPASAERLRLHGCAANHLICISLQSLDREEQGGGDLTYEFFVEPPGLEAHKTRRRRRRLARASRNGSRERDS